jgi:hypothetical protein
MMSFYCCVLEHVYKAATWQWVFMLLYTYIYLTLTLGYTLTYAMQHAETTTDQNFKTFIFEICYYTQDSEQNDTSSHNFLGTSQFLKRTSIMVCIVTSFHLSLKLY